MHFKRKSNGDSATREYNQAFDRFPKICQFQREKMFTTSIHGFRAVLAVLFVVLYLSGCSYGVSPPPPPQAPQPSGTLLKSQLRIGISPDYMPLAYRDPTFGLVFPPPRLNLTDDAGFDNPGNCSSFSGGRTGRPMLPCDLSIKKSSICPVLFRMNYVHTHTSN
jgi:hypothetical protein